MTTYCRNDVKGVSCLSRGRLAAHSIPEELQSSLYLIGGLMSDEVKQKRIYWKPEQRSQVWERAIELYVGGRSGGSMKQAVIMAQEQMLPAESQRRETGLHPEFMKFSKFAQNPEQQRLARIRLGLERDPNADAATLPGVEVALQATPLEEGSQPPTLEELEEWPEPEADPLPSYSTAEVVANAVSQFFTAAFAAPMEAAITRALQNGMKPTMDALVSMQEQMKPQPPAAPIMSQYVPQAAPAPEKRLPWQKRKITVVSNLERPQQRLVRAYPQLDIRFVHCDNTRAIALNSEGSEATFVMTRFVGHGAQKAVKGKCVLLPTGGGLSSLIKKVGEHMNLKPGNGGARH